MTMEELNDSGNVFNEIEGNEEILVKRIAESEKSVAELEKKLTKLIDAFKEAKNKAAKVDKALKKVIFSSKNKTKDEIISELSTIVTENNSKEVRNYSPSIGSSGNLGENLFAQIELKTEDKEDERSDISDLEVSSVRSKVSIKSLPSERHGVRVRGERQPSNMVSQSNMPQQQHHSHHSQENTENALYSSDGRRKTLIRVMGSNGSTVIDQLLIPHARNKQRLSSLAPMPIDPRNYSRAHSSFQDIPGTKKETNQPKTHSPPRNDESKHQNKLTVQPLPAPDFTSSPLRYNNKKSNKPEERSIPIPKTNHYSKLKIDRKQNSKLSNSRAVLETDETQKSQLFSFRDDLRQNPPPPSDVSNPHKTMTFKKLSQKLFSKLTNSNANTKNPSPDQSEELRLKTSFFFRKKGDFNAPENL